jgi:poly(3-hydroxyalkanoate) synthetase
VDNLFIGDKLTRNQLQSSDGTVFDLRNVTSPIIVFTSTEDNISPPPQTLGWISICIGTSTTSAPPAARSCIA